MFYANGDADVGEWKDDMEHDEHGEQGGNFYKMDGQMTHPLR